ncbi:segregation and condensation protein B [Clostridia bacterium]|nr:segregation and condensation protein B [Clostridia bacterium]
MNNKERIKSAFESMMFVFGEPIEVKVAAAATGIDKAEALSLFRELAREYEEQARGIRVRETGGRFGFVTYEENYDYIRTITTPAKERRLSQAALEALAIVAYKQPVTKSEIDRIRGIKSDRVVEGLAEKELIEERGRSEAIGRPVLYGTTAKFLEYFDLKDLGELPELDDDALEEAIRDFSGDGADQDSDGEAWGQTKLVLSEN